ncbi:MAG: hypothetical protein H7A41_03885 [Chlamydiales bacterium]|nr:hypothetical protein [Chlamydiia bacterium]MCP5504274.1 hypothetical protein [Chlamydiales bacterium]
MKKILSILTLFAFTLYANDTPPIENPDTEAPTDVSSPVYATPNPPVREREEKPSSTWKATTAVIGTLAAITLGLFVSGRDTGKHYHKSSEEKKAS